MVQQMAFISDRSGTLQLYLLTIGHGGGVRLLDAQDVSSNYRPVWSADGTALVYEVTKPTGTDIALVQIDQPLVEDSNPRILALRSALTAIRSGHRMARKLRLRRGAMATPKSSS